MARRNFVVKRAWGVVVAAVVMLCLSGCGGTPVVVAPAELVGEWVSEGPNEKIVSFEFRKDGTFDFAGMPKGLFCAQGFEYRIWSEDWAEPDSGSGTWSLSYEFEDNIPLALRADVAGCGARGSFVEIQNEANLSLIFDAIDEGSPKLRFVKQGS